MKKNIRIKNICENCSLPIYNVDDIDFFVLEPGEEKYIKDIEKWRKHDENNNLVYFKDSVGYKCWSEYDEDNRRIHFKTNINIEFWYKWNKNNDMIEITEKEYKEIEFRKKEKEYNSRTKCSRFELMEI